MVDKIIGVRSKIVEKNVFAVFGDAEDTKKRCWPELPSSVTLVQTIDIIRLCQRGN